MTALVPLHFATSDVRMIVRDGEPWWVGIDVAAALGIVKAHQALSALEDYERGTYIVGTPSGDQEMIVINESGFYSLLFRSRKPIAAQFKRWLTCEVLPSIRKFGSYPPPIIEPKDDRPFLIQGPAAKLTRQQRFLEEARLYEARTGYSVFDIPGISKQRIKAIELGASMSKTLGRRDLWIYLMSAGFDLYYIMFGDRRQARARADNPFTGDW